MNSSKLQLNHIDIYENFFAEHEKVISLPIGMNRAGTWSQDYNGPNIKQKLPIRNYIGLTRTQNTESNIGKISLYNSLESKFETYNTIDYLPYHEEIEQFVNENYHGDPNYCIDFLCEGHRGLGLGFDSVICGLLSSWICSELYGESFSNEHFSTWHTSKEFEQSQIFQKIVSLEQGLMTNILSYNMNSYIFSSLAYGPYPIIKNNLDQKKSARSLVEFSKNQLGKTQNGDHFIIYCGEFHQTQSSLVKNNFVQNIHNSIDNVDEFLTKNELDEFKLSNRSMSKLFDIKYADTERILGIEVLNSIIGIRKKLYSQGDIEAFVLSINRQRYSNTLNNIISRKFANLINHIIIYMTKHTGKLLGASFTDGSGTGGCLSFFMYKNLAKTYIYKCIEDYSLGKGEIGLIYSNREDGIETEGLKIEQDLSRSIYSKHIASHNYKLTKIGGECIIGDHNQLIKNSGLDIIFDKVGNKVYLMGQQTTSAQLFSQTATVELFDILIRHAKTRVTNKDLPPSAYSKSRNEMYGKIIGPFVHLVHEQCNKSLDLEMKGTGSQYSIKFGPGNLTFGIIEERGNVKKK